MWMCRRARKPCASSSWNLQRIASHLVWLGTSGLDLAAMSMFLYCFREREQILDIFELVSGQRMMTTYIRPGGVWRDVPVEFETAVRDFIKIFPKRIDEYETLLTKNPLFIDRMVEHRLPEQRNGSFLRGDGSHAPRFRRGLGPSQVRPYCGYEQYEFQCARPDRRRYLCALSRPHQELRESLKIVEQALNKLPLGPVRSENRKFVPPPRSEIGVSMEALIHHFKLWTEGFPAPDADPFTALSNPRAVSWAFCSLGTADPNRAVSTCARLRSTTFPCCPKWSRDIWWQTWSPSSLPQTSSSEILTDEP
jgi:NADH-quinone oxidoreductase subunit D